MLWRALQHVQNGTYVDVGAQHPVVDSVSKAFYERGWRGIHIEPVPHYAELLRQDRPDETVLQIALSDAPGILDLNVIADTGLSTGVKDYADLHRSAHGYNYKTVPTPTLPLKSALAFLEGRSVHWLKIDVEGLEEKVLLGWDSKALRPWIVVIEATVPMSTSLHYEGAERILLEADYEFAYFDGLNRFYVASEHSALMPSLQVPPNVFDNVQLSGMSGSWCDGVIARHQAERSALVHRIEIVQQESANIQSQMNARLEDLSRELEDARARIHHSEIRAVEADARASIAEANAQHANERASLAEARASHAENQAAIATNTRLRRLVSALEDGRVTQGIKRRMKTAIRVTAIVVGRDPAFKRAAGLVLRCIPPLRRRLQRMLAPPPDAGSPSTPEKLLPLSPDSFLVYRQLCQGHARTERT